MTQILRQSTAVDVLIGPFVDLTNGATAETGESPSVKLSKNGQALAAKNDVTTPVHDADGYYNCELDATDTDTVGTLVLTVAATANALPVRHEFQVVEEAVYDAMYASSAVGPATAAIVNAQVLDVLNVDTFAEPTGVPGATVTLAEKIGRIYMYLRNKRTVTSSKETVFDDGDAAEYEYDLSDDGTTFTRSEANSV